jgi:hypothetical protein
LLQALLERRKPSLPFRIVRGDTQSTAMRRMRSRCCARAASGHTAAPRYELAAADTNIT